MDRKLELDGMGWSDLFDSWRPWENGDSGKLAAEVPSWDGRKGYTCGLGHYCQVTRHDGSGPGHEALFVVPGAAVVNLFRNGTLHVPSDTLTFQAIVRGDGSALVLMQHGQIIGSHWLAMLDGKDIPGAQAAE